MTGKQEDRISVTREQLADLLNEDLAENIKPSSPMLCILRY